MTFPNTPYSIALFERDRTMVRLLHQSLSNSAIAHTIQTFPSLEDIALSHQQPSFAMLLIDITLLNTPSQLADVRSLAPDVPILVFGALSHYAKMLEAMQYGAHSYLLSDRSDPELVATTIRTALEFPSRTTAEPPAIHAPSNRPTETDVTALERLHRITAAIPGVVYEYRLSAEREQQFLLISRGVEDLYGYSAEAVIADASLLWDRIVLDDMSAVHHSIQRSWETLEPWKCTYRIQCPNAPVRWIHGQATPTQQPDGSVIWCGLLMDVTDRLSAQTALTDAEACNRALVDGLPDLLIRMKADGIYLACKAGDGVQLYKPEQTHAGCSVYDTLPADHAKRRMHFVKQALATQTIQHYQQDIEIQGDRHYEDIRIVPINAEEVLVIVRNMTEQQRATCELQHQKAFLRQIIDAVDCLIYVRDAEGRYLSANRGTANHLGVTPEVLVGKREIDVGQYNPIMFENQLKVNREVMRTEQAIVIADEYLPRYDGSAGWFQTRIAPFYDVYGKVRGIVGVSIDITKRRNLEQALQQRLNQLATINSVTATIRQSLDLDTIFQTAVKLLAQTFQCDRACMFTFNSVEELLTQDSMPHLVEYRESSIISVLEHPIPIPSNLHLRHLLLDDEAIASNDVYRDPLLQEQAELCRQIHLKSMLAVRTSYQGRANGVVALHQCCEYRAWTAEDQELIEAIAAQIGVAIAHARTLAQSQQQRQALAENNQLLAAAQAATEAANQAKSNFMSRMNHELRAPLNVILGYAQLSLKDPELPPDHQDWLQAIIASSHHLLELIHDVLDFSKLEAGAIAFNSQDVDLSALLLMLRQMFQVQAESKHLRLDLEAEPDVPFIIHTDGNKLRQILINLLSNALKFTHQGGIGVRISSQDSDESHCTLCIEVIDTGVGIAPEVQTEVFKPYVQSGPSSGGTGLGLAIIREFLNIMQGTIELESQLGQGSTFRILLPVGVVQPATQNPNEARDRPTNPRVLVVDESNAHSEQLERLLIAAGIDTHLAKTPQDAIARCQSYPPHLLIVVADPVQTNPTWLTKIQAHRHHYPRIVALTHSDQAAIAPYCDRVITTPLHDLDFRQLIRDAASSDRVLTADPPFNHLAVDHSELKALSPQQLSTLPVPWLQTIAAYTVRCDDKPLRQLVSQLPPEHSALRDALLFKIDNFLFEELLRLAEAALEIANC